LETTKICYNELEKQAKDCCKDYPNIHWVPSAIFDRLKPGAMAQNYQMHGNSDRIASIYVF